MTSTFIYLICNIDATFQSDRIIDIKTSVLHVNGEPTMITLDYIVDGTDEAKIKSGCTEKDLR